MPKNLVIVESPAKAKTLEKFLGKDFKVAACGGHIRDLPKKSLGVNIKEDFKPNYVILKERKKILDNLKSAAKKAKIVFLAPDPDREGEAIAWHLKYILEGAGKIKRIEFNEITKEAVQKAVKHPREIDMQRVDAQQARRILDRLVGYKISPLLWKKIRKGLSAGRVQSAAVRLICEREKAITEFKPEEYWSITAKLSPEKQTQEFEAKLIKKPKDKTETDKILKDLKGASYSVAEIRRKETKRNPAPAFITSTLQQEAARKLGFSSKKTMFLAQKLYEGENVKGEGRIGLITYMRTDSVRIANQALTEVRKYIEREFGAEYLPEKARHYKTKKTAQDAHEAIRPTSVYRTPDKMQESLQKDELRLYELIWKRFIACQMNPAILDQTSVDIKAKNYLFRATGSVIKFDGFITLYMESRDEEGSEGMSRDEERMLPQLKQNEVLNLLELKPAQHFTQPPPRYTEASLIKELEQKGIGRPSTYAPIIATIQGRNYVIKEGRALKPTEIGIITNEQLVKHFPRILDLKFTAHMEDDLDDIVAGKMKWIEALKEFYDPFEKELEEANVQMEKIKKEVKTDQKCPTCGKNLVIRQSRFGDFLGCSGYPKCRFTKPLAGKEEKQIEQSTEVCDKCGKPMVLKSSRFGKFMACSGYPKCKNIKPILKKIGVKCPEKGCGGELVVRRTKKRKVFYSCSNYPKCKFMTWVHPAKGGKESENK